MEQANNQLRRVRSARGLTQGALGKLVGKSQQQVAKIENGITALTAEDAVSFARALQVRLEEVLGIADRTQAKIIGRLGPHDMIYGYPDDSAVQLLDAPPLSPPGIVAIEVIGDAAYPRYQNGDVLFCLPPEPPGTLIGQDCIVTFQDGRMALKRILNGSRADAWTLTGVMSPDVLMDVEITSARRVKWISRSDRKGN